MKPRSAKHLAPWKWCQKWTEVFCSEGMVISWSYWQWVNWKSLFDLRVYRMFARQCLTSDISTLANCVKKLLCKTGSSPVCFPFFCSCQNNHIINRDESIYQQIKTTTRHDDMFSSLMPCDTSLLQHLVLQSLSPCRSVERPKVVQVSRKVNQTCDEFGDGGGGSPGPLAYISIYMYIYIYKLYKYT